MNTYGNILPGATKLARIPVLSKEAKQRLAWIDYYRKHGNGRLTCRYFGIPPKTFYKWLKRYDDLGMQGLEPVSKRPHTFRESKIPLQYIDRTVYWRRLYPMYSKYKISVILQREDNIKMSPSTVGRVFVEHHLFFPTPITAKNKRYRRALTKQHLDPYYRSKQPGELVEVDMKHLSFFGTKKYIFAGIDCMTKRLAVHVATSSSSKQASQLLDKLTQTFPYPISQLRVDNGSENLKDFAYRAKELNMEQNFTRVNRPKDKPFVERVIGTIEREFIQQGKLAFDIRDQRVLIDEWVNHYNTFRPHESLNYLTPEAYESTLNLTN
jgi:transposase InsO family protein